jgi:site-specific DNA recombinase
MLNALGTVRLSHSTDESTSPARQRQRIDWWTGGNAATPVDVAEDLDVSGSVSPFDRDQLGPWLTDRPPAP